MTHGHMHANGEVYKRGGKSIRSGGEQPKVKEGKKIEEKKKRKRRNGERKMRKRKLAFQRSELVGPRSKVRIFEEGYTPRGAGYTPVEGSHLSPRG